MDQLLACQAMFGIERGNEIRELVETATGEPCPCLQNERCPLLALPRLSVVGAA